MIARPKAYLNGAYVLYKKYEGAAVFVNSSTFARQNTCLAAFTRYNKEPSSAQPRPDLSTARSGLVAHE